MKPLAISSTCIIILLAIWSFFIYYANNTLNDMADELDDLIYIPVSAEEWETAREEFALVSMQWHQDKTILYMLSQHGTTRDIDVAFARLEEHLKNETKPEALLEIAIIKEHFRTIQQYEAFSIDNIF